MSPAERVAALTLRWVRAYTRRLPDAVADDRRAELVSDVFEQRARAARAGTPGWVTAAGILRRMLAGLPADLSWRARQLGAARGAVLAGADHTVVAAAAEPQRRLKHGTTRRAFLRRSMGVGSLGLLGGFGAAAVGFLWPDLRGGFGGEVEAGEVDHILEVIRTQRTPFVVPAARTYLVEYDAALDPDGRYADVTDGGTSPVMALYWRCAHLGCRVPWCVTSQWLECPCHGSAYNRWGEYADGPAPRGLDRFPVQLRDGTVVVDTSQVFTGPARRSGILNQPREGLACVTLGAR